MDPNPETAYAGAVLNWIAMTETIVAHPELWRGLDEPCEADQHWFHTHPDGIARLRPQMPDEIEARDTMAQVMGSQMINLGGFGPDGHEAPRTWMVVVDVFRLKGIKHGPNGESGRVRFACPEPTSDSMGDAIKRMAVDGVDAMLEMLKLQKRHNKRAGGGLGFG